MNKKSGSDKVWVYSLKGTKNLKEYVIPFYQKYVVPYSSKHKVDVFEKFFNTPPHPYYFFNKKNNWGGRVL